MMSGKTRSELTNIVIYIVLPCSIFNSFHKGISADTLRQCGVVLIIAFCMQLLYIVLNRVLYIRVRPEKRVILQYATICNNAGFMGLPVIEAVFGSTGLLYGAIVLIPIRIFMWTAGLGLFTRSDVKGKIKVLATHPCIWAVILGFLYVLLPFELPGFITGTIGAIGECTTALTMIVVGSVLSEVDIKNVLDVDCFRYSLFRLILIPAFVYGVLTVLGADTLVRGVSVLSCAMPCATTTVMLAEKYGRDAAFASKLLFVSTVLSMATLPVIALILKT